MKTDAVRPAWCDGRSHLFMEVSAVDWAAAPNGPAHACLVHFAETWPLIAPEQRLLWRMVRRGQICRVFRILGSLAARKGGQTASLS